jgi:FlaA1/EpsC-like NDP-sugar epimerase/lipopolysaccharide/colanic/teichoic acid biosynthesis glycosyltransferase
MIKRFIDFIIAIEGLIFFSPLIILIWFLIKISKRGSAIVKEERVGKNQKLIYLYRFDVYQNSNSVSPSKPKNNKNDGFTRIGNIIHILDLESLPLLFNIFKGDLSLIGPQPEKKEFLKYYSKEQKKVFTVRPGILCPSNFLKDELDNRKNDRKLKWKKYYRDIVFPERIKADLHYVQNNGLGRDIRVLFNCIKIKFNKIVNDKFMKEAKSRNFLLPIDQVLIFVSYFISYQLRFEWKVPQQEYTIFLKCFMIVLFVRVVTFYIFGIYKNLWKYVGLRDLLNIIWACTISSIIIVSTIFLLGIVDHSRSIFFIDWFLCISLVGGSRLALRLMSENNANSEQKVQTNVLIIGAGDVGDMTLRMLHFDETKNNKVVGFIDKDSSIHGKTIQGVKVLGDYSNIPELVSICRVDEVLIAVPELSSQEMKTILKYCKEANVRHRIVPAVNDMFNGSLHLSKFREIEISDLFGRQQTQLDISAIQSFLKNKRILVTGAGGSIGSELCRQISEYSPGCIILIDKGENYLHEIRCELDSQIESFPIYCNLCNITNRIKLRKIFEKYNPEIIFHAAAHKHVPLSEENPEEAIWNNVYGTQQLAELADEFGVDVFVMVSTDKAVNPTSIMGVTKRIAELYIQAQSAKSNTKFVTVRFGNVLNSNGSVIPIFKRQIEKGGPITITHPEVKRFFMSISEAVQLILQVTTMGKSGEIFILEMGKSIRILDLAIELIQQSGFKPYEDISIKLIGLRPGEKLYEELIGCNEEWVETSHKSIKIIKFKKPINFEQIEKKITGLINNKFMDDHESLIDMICKIVPEYVPFAKYSKSQVIKNAAYHNIDFTIPYDKTKKLTVMGH